MWVQPRGRDPPRPARESVLPSPGGRHRPRGWHAGAPGAPLPEESRRGRPSPPPREGARCERQQRPAGTGLPPRGTAPAAEGENTTQPPSAGIRHVRAAAELPLPAAPAVPPPPRALRGCGRKGNGGPGAALTPASGLPLPPCRLSHAGLSAMLARRPLTPSARRHRRPPGRGGPRLPPARPPGGGPASPGASLRAGERGASALTHPAALHLPPPVAAGLAPRRRTNGERSAGGTSPSTVLDRHRHSGWRRCCPTGRPSRVPRPPLPLPLLVPEGTRACPAPDPGEGRAPSAPSRHRCQGTPRPAPGLRVGVAASLPPARPPPPPRREPRPGGEVPGHRYSREITARKIW